MKIKQELLETLIRVCAKEVLTQLNEGKCKKCKCGKNVIFGEKKCKECKSGCLKEVEESNTAEGKEVEEEGKDKKWIQKAIKKPGALHKQLHVPQDEKIPSSKLNAAASKGGKLGKRANLAKTLKGLNKEDATSGAAAPPLAGQGAVDLPEVPRDETPIDNEPSGEETPKTAKKKKLQGIVLYTPSGEIREVPFRMWADDASIERTLHRVGSSIGGSKVKIAIQTMKKVKSGLNDKTPTYIYIGKYDPSAEELFVFADRNLDVAKEESIKPDEHTEDSIGDAEELHNRDQEVTNDDELLAKHLAGEDRPTIDKEIGFDDSESGQD